MQVLEVDNAYEQCTPVGHKKPVVNSIDINYQQEWWITDIPLPDDNETIARVLEWEDLSPYTYEKANTDEFGISMKVVDSDIEAAKIALRKPKKAKDQKIGINIQICYPGKQFCSCLRV